MDIQRENSIPTYRHSLWGYELICNRNTENKLGKKFLEKKIVRLSSLFNNYQLTVH